MNSHPGVGVSVESGTSLVLLHGLGADHRMWVLQTRALQQVGQLWVPDLPGFGAEPPAAPARRTPEAYADWVAAGIEARGGGPVGAFGYSMGGSLALLLALRRPDLVRSVALCCSSPCWGRGWRKIVARLFSSLGGEGAMDLFQRSVAWGASRHARDASMAEQIEDMVRRAHRPTMLALYRALAELDLRPLLDRVRVPALVVGGTRDLLSPLSHQRMLARGIPRARHLVLRGGDHFLCLGRAAEFADALVDFTRTPPRPAGSA